MKMLMCALYSSVAILVLALTTYIPAAAQQRIEDRFASVNGVRLHYLIAGKRRPSTPPARVRGKQPHVAAIDVAVTN